MLVFISFFVTTNQNNMKSSKLYLIVDHRGFDLCGEAFTKTEAELAKKSFQDCGIYCHMKEANENFILTY